MSPRPIAPIHSRRGSAERGSALVWALFFVSLTVGVLVAHSLEMSANRKTMETRYRRIDLAKNIAESGLTETTAYLRRQPVQPVVTFAPQLDPAADPPLNETLDPDVGLVREFEVSGNLWGRYEIRKDKAVDVSGNYSEPPGTVWDVESRGYLYEVKDAQKPFDQRPNRILSLQTIRTEMRGLPVQVPGTSAVVVMDPTQVVMIGGGSILGDTKAAISYAKPAGPVVAPVLDVSITGLPTAVAINGLSIDVQTVFHLRQEQLRNLSDVVLSSPRQIYGRVAKDLAVYSPGDLILPASGASLRGRMLLFVDGDFIAQNGNNSDFAGVIYARGNVVLEGPFQFRGTIVVGGIMKVGGTADMVSIVNDQTAVQELSAALGRYRISKDLRPAAPGGAFADPSDLANVDAIVR